MNNSDNGYCKMPDGTLIQWGKINNGDNSTPGAAVIYLSQPFVDGNFSITANINYQTIYEGFNTYLITQAISNVACAIYFRQISSPSTSITDTNAQAQWVAMGRWK